MAVEAAEAVVAVVVAEAEAEEVVVAVEEEVVVAVAAVEEEVQAVLVREEQDRGEEVKEGWEVWALVRVLAGSASATPATLQYLIKPASPALTETARIVEIG